MKIKKIFSAFLMVIFAITICFTSGTIAFAKPVINSNLEKKVNDCLKEMYQVIKEKGQLDQRYLMSSNPYDYIKDNAGYDNLVKLGPKSLPVLQYLIENKRPDYYIAIAMEDISKVSLKNDFKEWDSAETFAPTFRNYVDSLPQKVKEVVDSKDSDANKNIKLEKLGILATPYINSYLKNGKSEYLTSLKSLLEEGNLIESALKMKHSQISSLSNDNNNKINEIEQLSRSMSTQGLVYPSSYYDKYSWTWHYYLPADSTYNCLGYALGRNGNIWPWGTQPATHAEAISYLRSQGYDPNDGIAPKIIAYGNSTKIIHFAKYIGTSEIKAKWGELEVMTQYSTNPYYEYNPNDAIKKYNYGYSQITFWK